MTKPELFAIASAFVLPVVAGFYVLFSGPAQTVLSLSPSGRLLDMTFLGYTFEHVATEFAAYEAHGRAAYADVLYRDKVFIPIYSVSMAAIIVLCRRRNGRSVRWLLLFPPLAALTDWIEDSLNESNLAAYPALDPATVQLASSATIIKWIFVVLMLLAVAIALWPAARQLFRARGARSP